MHILLLLLSIFLICRNVQCKIMTMNIVMPGQGLRILLLLSRHEDFYTNMHCRVIHSALTMTFVISE